MTYVRILEGDVLARLKDLPDESIHCIVTSPPYFGLRDYGVAGQIGLEATPGDYIQKLVQVFCEIRRVLRKDGTVWLNLGDSYAGSGKGGNPEAGKQATNRGSQSVGVLYGKIGETARRAAVTNVTRKTWQIGAKPKDLLGMPWRIAFALQDDGWWLRSDIIYAKPNPMPESVVDRPVSSHEHVFLLAKSLHYYYDIDAIREPHSSIPEGAENDPDGWKIGEATEREGRPGIKDSRGVASRPKNYYGNIAGRNKRDVWIITTEAFPEAHFATFPKALVEPCIKAGTSAKGVCFKCGAPWKRIVKAEGGRIGTGTIKSGTLERSPPLVGWNDYNDDPDNPYVRKELGWEPTCNCGADVVPATVLDPFGGSGTTGIVANELGRDCILIELSPKYVKMAERRIADARGVWVDIEVSHESHPRRVPKIVADRQDGGGRGQST